MINVESILDLLSSQAFANWYEKKFIDYIEGAENAPSKEDILKFLEYKLERK